MSTNESSLGRSIGGFFQALAALAVLLVALGIGYTFLPKILATPLPRGFTLPTSVVIPQPQPGSSVVIPRVPTQSLEQVQATSQAIYHATAQAAEPSIPNVNNTGDAAPVIRQSISVERQPAGDNVPTAEPVPQGETNGMFGSKPVIVNPQETHECKHGQVWVDGKGCKNP